MCKLRVWWLDYIGTSHTSRSPYYENVLPITILWHTKCASPYYEKFCTTKVTILWLYIVQNVQVASMVTVLYRHQSHITITILWKFCTTKVTILWLYIVQNVQVGHTSPYYEKFCHQGHHTVTLIVQNVQVASMVTHIGTSHTSRSPYYEKFCTTKVTYCDCTT